MPIANHPKQTCDIVLEVDQDRPESERPVFVCRFLTRVEMLNIPAKLKEIAGTNDPILAHQMLDDLLAVGIVGWRNMNDPATGKALPFARESFDKLLTEHEKFELVGLMVTTPILKEIDRKKSSSPSPSGGGSSAAAAREGSVTTSPPQIDPSTSTTPAPSVTA